MVEEKGCSIHTYIHSHTHSPETKIDSVTNWAQRNHLVYPKVKTYHPWIQRQWPIIDHCQCLVIVKRLDFSFILCSLPSVSSFLSFIFQLCLIYLTNEYWWIVCLFFSSFWFSYFGQNNQINAFVCMLLSLIEYINYSRMQMT